MSDIKFSCPQCQQHIQADEGYGGMEIACPACSTRMIVPRVAPAPAAVTMVPSAPVPVPPAPVLRTSVAAQAPAAGQRFQPGAAAARPQSARVQRKPGPTNWLRTPYPYIGVVMVGFAVLFFLAKGSPPMLLAYVVAFVLYAVAVQIVVTVAAFRQSALTGVLTLLISPYALYFVLRKSESPFLKALYGSAVLIGLSFYLFGLGSK
jgi:DNA-directed RNA polymerase subunit RPC12/RpoP